MNINLANLRRARDAFAAVERVDMRNFFTFLTDDPDYYEMVTSAAQKDMYTEHSCKTAMCLAGSIQDTFALGADRQMSASAFSRVFLYEDSNEEYDNTDILDDAFDDGDVDYDDEEEEDYMYIHVADALFFRSEYYGRDKLDDVTKDDVLGKLDELILKAESEK